MKRPGEPPPQWAHAAAGGAIVVPAAGKAAVGYAPREKVPAGWWNYHLNLLGQWAGYLAGPSMTVWPRYAFPSPDGAYATPVRAAVDWYTEDLVEARYRYVVVAHDGTGACVLVSRRGQEWALRRNLPAGAASPVGVTFARDLWLVCTSSAIYYAERDDASYPSSGAGASALRDTGIDWGTATLPGSPGTIRGVAYAGNEAGGMVVASTSTKILVSNTYGLTWSDTGASGRQAGRDIAASTVQTAVEISSDAGDGYIVRATGGLMSWTHVQTLSGTGSDTTWRLALGPTDSGVTTFVAYKTGVTNPRVHKSTDDGVTWVAVSTDAALQNLTSLAYRDGVWVATSAVAPYAFTSSDLEHWISVPVPVPLAAADASLLAVVFAGGSWLLVSPTGVLQGAPAVDPSPEGYTPNTTATMLSNAGWLRGRILSTTAPTNGQVYAWNSGTSQWEPVAASSLSVTTTRGDLIVRGASADERLAIGAAARYLRSDGTDPSWAVLSADDIAAGTLAVARGGTGSGTAAGARSALGVQDGPRLIPLFALANSSSATPAVVGYAGFTPAAYAIAGRTTTLTLDAIGQVSGAGLTGTLEVLDAAGSTVATLTWTETTATRKTASITLPGSAEIYRARVSCTGVVDPLTEYALLGGANLRITWS